jgi:hypothetical protein
MSSTELNRVQEDMNLIKVTLGVEFPYDRWHILMCLVAAGGGIVVALTAIADWRPQMRAVLLVYFVGMLLLWYVQVRKLGSERAARPRVWRWTVRETWSTLVGAALLIPYILMVRYVAVQQQDWSFEQWRDHVAGPVIFFVGVAVFSVCITTREMRAGLAWGIAAILGGLAVPWCPTIGQSRLVLGAVLIFGGLASAAILYWQISEAERNDVTD